MKRSKSAKRWLKEHFDDRYVAKAQALGYRSRAAFKLLALQEKYRLLQPGMFVADLGASPGGWSQIIASILNQSGHVFALDCLPMEAIDGVTFIQGDFTEDAVLNELLDALDDRLLDAVFCDMAPNLSGVWSVDGPKSYDLCELAFHFCEQVLKEKGCFVVKVFQCQEFDSFLKLLRAAFDKVIISKPDASRQRSRELYLIGIGYKRALV